MKLTRHVWCHVTWSPVITRKHSSLIATDSPKAATLRPQKEVSCWVQMTALHMYTFPPLPVAVFSWWATTSPNRNIRVKEWLDNWSRIQYGLVLRRLVLRRFTFTTLVQSDRALPTCGAPLSQFKRPFCTQISSGSFPVCMCFFFFYFSAVLLSSLWFSPHDLY